MFIRQLMIQYGNIYNIEYNIDTMYRNSMQYFPWSRNEKKTEKVQSDDWHN